VPTAADTAHALAECSNAGICNRGTGKCECFDGFEGDACQRSAWWRSMCLSCCGEFVAVLSGSSHLRSGGGWLFASVVPE